MSLYISFGDELEKLALSKELRQRAAKEAERRMKHMASQVVPGSIGEQEIKSTYWRRKRQRNLFDPSRDTEDWRWRAVGEESLLQRLGLEGGRLVVCGWF